MGRVSILGHPLTPYVSEDNLESSAVVREMNYPTLFLCCWKLYMALHVSSRC